MITYSSSAQIKTYINGNLAHTYSGSGTISTAPQDLWIGGRAAGQYFDGLIDDVRIYDRPLNAIEVNELLVG